MKVAFALLLAAQLYAADPLRVMTFNVRYPAKSDGNNVWENRRDLLVETIRKYRPDVMGTQELFHIQGQYIVEKLPEYKWFGVSRRGTQEDEHMGVFYRPDRLRVVDSGNYWLSEKPEEPGSIAWNMSLPRMVTWAVFEDLKNKRRFHYINTHFAHRREDAEARLQSAKLIAARIARIKEPVVLTGDFNTGAGTPPHTEFTTLLTDAWAAAKKTSGPTGTFHGFNGQPGEARIDWILYRGFEAQSAESVTHNENGRYPSDHFPVIAVLDWK